MKLVWTRFRYLGDIIVWGLEEPSSHFAVEIDGYYYHSTMFAGFHRSTPQEFYKYRKLVHVKNLTIPMVQIDKAKAMLEVDVQRNIKYDYLFLFWLIYRAILLKLFRIPLPKDKLVQSLDSDLCTEILNDNYEFTGLKYDPHDVMTPHRLWLALKDD